MLCFIFYLPVFSLTEKYSFRPNSQVLSENLPPEREHLFPDNQRSCLFTSKRSYTKSFKITKSTNVQIHGHIFLVQWRYDDRQKKIRFLKALTRSLMIFSCLDIQRRIKLHGLNKAIVVNINFLKILNSGFVVCCHHCLFQTNHSIFVEIKRKKVVHGWQADQVVVEPTLGFRSRPPSPGVRRRSSPQLVYDQQQPFDRFGQIKNVDNMRRCPMVQILSWNEYLRQLHNQQIAKQMYR